MAGQNTFGLDIGSSSVKMVQLHQEGQSLQAVAAAWEDVERSGGDQLEQEARIVAAIRACVEKTANKATSAVCGVGGAEVSVGCFDLPPLPADEVEQVIELEAAQVCPFEVADSTIDYEIMDPLTWLQDEEDAPQGNDVRGIMVAATNNVVQSRRNLIASAGYTCTLMDVDSLALLNCFSACKSLLTEKSMAILNVGDSCTNLIIVPNQSLPFMRDLSYSTVDIIEQIAGEHNISPAEVRQLLWEDKDSHSGGPDITDSLARASRRLIIDINETLRYYMAKERIPPAEKILACGALPLSSEFIELLDSQLSPEVVLWNPFEWVTHDADTLGRDIIEQFGPALTVATGLAMRTL